MEKSASKKETDLQLCHGIFRINTDISAGDQDIETVVRYAESAGVDFIVVSDQFLVYAKYGIPPFREVFTYSMEQKSIVSYGIDRYLARLDKVNRDNPELTVIAGADIAPHYYWTGNPFTKSFTANQFSEQITVFGPKDVEFYKNLPVIHNEPSGFFFPGTIISLLPLLVTLAGISLFIKHKGKYRDRQGHTHIVPGVLRFKILAIVLMLLGILWTWNNRPFHEKLGLSQYTQATQNEYQQTFDYIRKAEKEQAGVIWSAPEATMDETRPYASLLSVPFIDDIKYTHGYNGFAGIYGDVSSAHKPGSFWDDVLHEYCNGERKLQPIIVGERDWHGRGRLSIDCIKTVTIFRKQPEKPSEHQIINAIISGQSYAVVKVLEKEIVLSDIRLVNKGQSFSIPGETMKKGDGEPVLKISGHLIGKSVSPNSNPGQLVIIVDGEKTLSKKVELSSFNFETPVNVDTGDGKKHYVRLYIMTHSTPVLVCNPIFIED